MSDASNELITRYVAEGRADLIISLFDMRSNQLTRAEAVNLCQFDEIKRLMKSLSTNETSITPERRAPKTDKVVSETKTKTNITSKVKPPTAVEVDLDALEAL